MKKNFLILFSILIYLNSYSQGKIMKIENNNIIFSTKQEADSLFIYTSTFGYEKMNRENNVFSKAYKQDSLNYMYFTYSIYKFKNGFQELLENGIHKGKYFPKRPKRVKKLKGNIKVVPIHSKYLKEKRNIFIYTQNNFNKKEIQNLLFILDANKSTLQYHCSLIENLINEGKIDNLVVVGIPNREFAENDKYNEEIDFRALEFLEGFSTSKHSHHHGYSEIPKELLNRHDDFINFITGEVYDYIISNYNITKNYYKRAIYGTSNGGDFVVSLSRKKPHLFGSNMAFSFGWETNIKKPVWESNKLPKFYLAVGRYEKRFVEIVESWKSILEKEKAYFQFHKELSGHDNEMWSIKFVEFIEKIFNK